MSDPEKPRHGLVNIWHGLVRADAEWSRQRKMAPFPLFRWVAAIGILIWVATGGEPHSIGRWFTAYLPWLIVAGVLTLAPEVVRIEFGGLKMELLKEAREEIKELSHQVNQLQVQQAAANANATAGISQTFNGLTAVSEVTAATKHGEESKAVPAQDVDWDAYAATRRKMPKDPSDTGPSTGSEPGSTLES